MAATPFPQPRPLPSPRPLFSLGHVANSNGQKVLSIAPGVPVHTVGAHLAKPHRMPADWQTAMAEARGQHYSLTYFAARELCRLVKSVPHISRTVHWQWVCIIGKLFNTTYAVPSTSK